MMGFPFSFQATLCFDGKATVVAAAATVRVSATVAVASAAAAVIPLPRRLAFSAALLLPSLFCRRRNCAPRRCRLQQ